MKTDVRIKSVIGCGTDMIGDPGISHGAFRNREEGGTGLNVRHSEVRYLFRTFLFLPVVPLGCYRVMSHTGEILGEEDLRVGEIVKIYFFGLLKLPLVPLFVMFSILRLLFPRLF